MFRHVHIFRFLKVNGLIARHFRPFHFSFERQSYFVLDPFAAIGVYGVGDVRVKLHPALHILLGTLVLKLGTAVVAVFCTEVVFPATPFAVVAHLAGWHGNKEAVGALDDLDIADNKFVI
jgi:hypothetical protein